MVLDKQKGLKSLSKEKRQKLEAYQHLFYLLQVSRGLSKEKSLPSPEGLRLQGLLVCAFDTMQGVLSHNLNSLSPGKETTSSPVCLECH